MIPVAALVIQMVVLVTERDGSVQAVMLAVVVTVLVIQVLVLVTAWDA